MNDDGPGVDGALSLLALLQLTDSAFPSGAFAHSYGLEQLARERLLTTPSQLEGFVNSVICQSVATADASAAYGAALWARVGDLHAILALDRALYRTKAASELRAATLQTGRRLLEETAMHIDDALLATYVAAVRAGETLGTHPVAFGVITAALGVAPRDVAPALMLMTATTILQASMRLLPVSHRDVQAMLHALRPRIAALAHAIETAPQPGALMSFNPLQEIASMRHTFAPVRLFAS